MKGLFIISQSRIDLVSTPHKMQLDTVAPLLDTVQLISLQFDQKTETLAFPRGRGSEAEDAKLCALGERPGLTFPPETFPRPLL